MDVEEVMLKRVKRYVFIFFEFIIDYVDIFIELVNICIEIYLILG